MILVASSVGFVWTDFVLGWGRVGLSRWSSISFRWLVMSDIFLSKMDASIYD